MNATATLLANAGIVVKGRRIFRNGVQIDKTQRNNAAAQSVAVAYALGYMN